MLLAVATAAAGGITLGNALGVSGVLPSLAPT